MADTLQGQESWYIENFDLPACDVDHERRNFPGCDGEGEEYYTLEAIVEGDGVLDKGKLNRGGMTETDADTSEKMDGPYTRINQKKGKWEVVRNKLSATDDMYNTTKAKPFKSALRNTRGPRGKALGRGR